MQLIHQDYEFLFFANNQSEIYIAEMTAEILDGIGTLPLPAYLPHIAIPADGKTYYCTIATALELAAPILEKMTPTEIAVFKRDGDIDLIELTQTAQLQTA